MTNLSIGSLYLEIFFNDIKLSTGTGFIIKTNKGYYLMTNRHNFTGRSQIDNKPLHGSAAIPNKIKIYMLNRAEVESESFVSVWMPITELLVDENDTPQWVEHPSLGSKVDFAALKIQDSLKYRYICLELNNHSCKLAPSDRVNVLGYPFGISSTGNNSEFVAIWSTGFVASEPFIDYKGLPLFLIDCRTRPGQSGSPVYIVNYTGENDSYIKKTEADFRMKNFEEKYFLGIYSGRVNADSDLGFVWKSSSIEELIAHINTSSYFPTHIFLK